MHIAEGVLPAPVLAAGYVLAAGGVAVGLRRLDDDRIVQSAVLSAAFFAASLAHIPLGPVSIHLVLNGLMGLILGWAALPAVFVALLLQAALFGVGGLTALGVNTVIMGAPAVCCYYLLRPWLTHGGRSFAVGAAAGAAGIGLGALILAFTISLAGEGFATVGHYVFLGYLPLVGVEAAVTGSAVAFLSKAKSKWLEMAPAHA
ncbi:MAG: cobalt transporter CbiM [Candidatus Hydrogenedentota bacterium]